MDSKPKGNTVRKPRRSEFPDMRGKRVRVVEIIEYGADVPPFGHLDTHEENIEFSKKYIGKEGNAVGNRLDGSPSDEYVVTFDDGMEGSFIDCELELVQLIKKTKKNFIREFNSNDWAGFAGAEQWKHEPLARNNINSRGKETVVMVDPLGVFIIIEDDPNNDYGGYTMRMEFPTQWSARMFLEGFPKDFDDDYLLAKGFTVG